MFQDNNSFIIPFLVILLLVVCYISVNKTDKISTNNNNFLLYLIVIGIILFFIMKDVGYNLNNNNNILEGFNAPINHRLKPKCPIHDRNNIPLVRNVTISSPEGTDYTLTEDMDSSNFNPVDGRDGSPRHKFMFSHNQFKPECCPSTYSTSTGCLCRNEIQDRFIQSRGGNQSSRQQSMI